VDASIFIYTLLQHPRFLAPCQRFLEKVERGAVHALTSPLVLDEVAYKIIVERLKAILQQPLAPLVLERIKPGPGSLGPREAGAGTLLMGCASLSGIAHCVGACPLREPACRSDLERTASAAGCAARVSDASEARPSHCYKRSGF
jgi:hypothetical protein